MKHNQTPRFWHAAAQCLAGSIGLALLTFVCFRLHVSITTAALLYLIVVVLVSLEGSFVFSAVVSIIAILCLDYFFIEPRFHIDITLREPLNAVALMTFLGTASVVTSLMSKVRKSFQDIQAIQDQLRLVIDTMPAQVWSALPDGSRDFLNQRWLEYTGLSLEEGLGRGWQVAIHPEHRARFVDEWRAALVAGKPFETEARIRRADGAYRWLLIRAVPLRDELGNIVKWYGTSTDIEDRKQAEDALREQARLLDLTHDTVFVRDMNDVITYWNRGGEELYGLTREEALGKVTHQLLQTIFPAPLDEITAQLLRTGRWEGELVHSKADGTQLVVASRWALQSDPQGNPLAVLETNNDITGSKQAAQALRRHANLLEQAHDAIFVWEFPRTIVYWNRGAEQLYGFSREEAIGRPSHELLHTEHPMAMSDFEAALEREGEWTGELTHTTRDGRKIIVESRHVLMREEDGHLVVLEANRDITERRRAEAELRESERRYRHIFQTAGVSIWEEDFSQVKTAIDELKAKGVRDFRQYLAAHPEFVRHAIAMVKIVDVNDATVTLFGAQSKDELLRSLHTIFTPETQNVFAAELVAIAEGRTSFESETVLQNLQGDTLTVLFTMTLPPQPATLDSVLVSLTDITERRQAEEALRKAQAELAHVTRVLTVGELAASIAHEVNQPLTGVITNGNACLRWLARTPPDLDEAQEAVRRMIRDGNRASEVMARIRTLLRKAEPQKTRLAINDVIGEVIALADSEVHRNRVLLKSELAADPPLVLADRIQLQQVLLNLLLNGMEAMRAVTDRSRELIIRSQAEESDAISVAVQDAGVGIDPQDADRIFTTFFTTKPEGLGMGLAISRSIIEAHGGRLWATPNVGPGVTVQFTLPTSDESAP
jgi:PAS domain S-box-containing protein